jgi:hypothetical protein
METREARREGGGGSKSGEREGDPEGLRIVKVWCVCV